ncbi:hypothetical protein D3C76_1701710 [compost metagenome]
MHNLRFDAEHLRGVEPQYRGLVGFGEVRHLFEHGLDQLARVGERALAVRVVGGEQEVLDAQPLGGQQAAQVILE